MNSEKNNAGNAYLTIKIVPGSFELTISRRRNTPKVNDVPTIPLMTLLIGLV